MSGFARWSWLVLVLVGALALAAPGLAGFKSGQYVGTTSQDDEAGQPKNVGLQVPKNRETVNIVYFEFVAPPCGPNLQMAGMKTKLVNGKFKFVDEFGYGYVKGKFEAGRAHGTARYTFQERGCDSGVVEWTAKKK
jgi:hypothetical protein